jgi:hypothetical protein
LVLAVFLSGCSGVTIPSPDVNQEEEIKEVVNGYWSALSNRQYSLAKNYCMPHTEIFIMQLKDIKVCLILSLQL